MPWRWPSSTTRASPGDKTESAPEFSTIGYINKKRLEYAVEILMMEICDRSSEQHVKPGMTREE